MTLKIDNNYLKKVLLHLLEIPSPSGFTDQIVHFIGEELEKLKVPFELTRRGAIRATLEGASEDPARAVVAHLDTLGAMVRELKDNGRLAVMMIGHWSARFAEGARVTIFTDSKQFRGTILPLKASGHTYNTEIDKQPVSWDNLEVRIDERIENKQDLINLGFNVGDYIAVDTNVEVSESGFINSRHLDNKAGVASLLASIKSIKDAKVTLPVNCHPLFTISEEEGTGASSILHGNVASMVAIDNSTIAPSQNSSEYGVTIAMRDQSGVFDYHLTHKLIELCKQHNISHQRDVFRYYRSDSASALEAGNDIRSALICFGLDASHGYERTHLDSLNAVSRLVCNYAISMPVIKRDKYQLASLSGFTHQI